MAPPIKVGIVGYGFSARTFHIPFILSIPDLAIHAFLQRGAAPSVRGQPGSSCTDDYPSAKRYDNAEGFFGDKETELVVVTTGVGSHAELAEKALRAGKHVVVEKPFTGTSEEADRLIALQKETGKILTVFQSRRYDSDFRTLQKILATGGMGRIRECEIHYDWDIFFDRVGKTPYQPGDGMMFGLGSHTIDQALAVFGPPASVTGFYRTVKGTSSKTDEWFTVILQYSGEQSDLFVTIKTMMGSKMKPNLKYFVRGETGSFIKFGWDPQEEQIVAGIKPSDASYGVESPEIYGTLTTSKQVDPAQKDVGGNGDWWVGKYPSVKGDITDFYRDVVKAVRGEAGVVCKAEQSRNGIKVIELGRESAETGRTLPFA